MNIPAYRTLAGLVMGDKTFSAGDRQLVVTATNETECREFARDLEEAGFCCHQKNEMPAGSDRAFQKNLFYAYRGETAHVFVTFLAEIYTVYILVKAPAALPPTEKIGGEATLTPTVTQVDISAGMCYAVQFADGRFLLVDGGIVKPEDAEKLYNFLKEKSSGKPEVALWIFTHPDIDHIGLATCFLETYKDDVDIEAFAYQFPDMEGKSCPYLKLEVFEHNVGAFEKAIKEGYPNAPVYGIYAGQKHYFCGGEMEILWTGDLMYPYPLLSGNEMSITFKVTFDSGKTALFLGDAQPYACRHMASVYRDYLKCDVLQVAHHGLIGGDMEAYKFMDPDICLWSVRHDRFLGEMAGQRFQYCIGEGGCDFNRWIRDDAVRKRQHFDMINLTTIEMG